MFSQLYPPHALPPCSYVLRDFALAEARLAGDTARVWASLVPGGVPAGA